MLSFNQNRKNSKAIEQKYSRFNVHNVLITKKNTKYIDIMHEVFYNIVHRVNNI